MMPPNGKPIRRGQRRAWRGHPTGRHASRPVETTPPKPRNESGWPQPRPVSPLLIAALTANGGPSDD
jgi:hypothetical protein